jgi:twitching motility protein PilT
MSVEAVSPFGAPAPEPEPGAPLNVSVQDFLTRLLELDGSDLHLTAGAPPTVRVHGDLMRLDEYPLLDPETLRQIIYAILPQRHRERFEQDLELDTSYSLPGKARFRVNVYLQRDAIGSRGRRGRASPPRWRP